MKSVKVYHYDAFSKHPDKGNPAGIVLNGDQLTEKEMQEIAFKVGFSETAFSVPSAGADLRIRFFTPGYETDLCGHATIATLCALKSKGLFPEKDHVTIETRAGILPIRIDSIAEGDYQITMKQASPQFQAFHGSCEELACSLGLEKEDLDLDLPVLYGSTGVWTLLVPIKKLEAFKRMRPNNCLFPALLGEKPKASVHPFCLETYDLNAQMHSRHFSSPFAGTIEDPVTGTASGVMGAYYAKYIKQGNFENNLQLLVEQGQEMEKDGRVMVHILKNQDGYDIEITGSAVYVAELEVII